MVKLLGVTIGLAAVVTLSTGAPGSQLMKDPKGDYLSPGHAYEAAKLASPKYSRSGEY